MQRTIVNNSETDESIFARMADAVLDSQQLALSGLAIDGSPGGLDRRRWVRLGSRKGSHVILQLGQVRLNLGFLGLCRTVLTGVPSVEEVAPF